MPRTIRQLTADLRRAGFVLDRSPVKGGHTVWVYQPESGIEVVLSGNDGDDAKYYQEREVRDAFARSISEENRS